jgi:hypothetical protein
MPGTVLGPGYTEVNESPYLLLEILIQVKEKEKQKILMITM